VKIYLMTLLTLFALNHAKADLAVVHQDICLSDNTKALMGEHGSCRMIITPINDHTSGSCVGNLGDELSCEVKFNLDSKSGSMVLNCGKDLKNPDLSQEFEVKSHSYRVSALIQKVDGTFSLTSSPIIYRYVSHSMMTVLVSDQLVHGKQERAAEIMLSTGQGNFYLSQIKCEQ
jgi:hypothetical protein